MICFVIKLPIKLQIIHFRINQRLNYKKNNTKYNYQKYVYISPKGRHQFIDDLK